VHQRSSTRRVRNSQIAWNSELPPKLPGGRANELEFPALIIENERVLNYGRGEAALRAQRELRKGKMAASLHDASAQISKRLKPAEFRADQSQNDKFMFRYVFKRVEGTRAVIIVLQQESIDVQAPEQLFTNRLVTSLGKPTAALIAASEMKPESNIGETCDHRVVELDPLAQPLV
jgi:hypothetical protein